MAQRVIRDKIVSEIFRLSCHRTDTCLSLHSLFLPYSLACLFGQIHEFYLPSCEQPLKCFKKKTDMYIQVYILQKFP